MRRWRLRSGGALVFGALCAVIVLPASAGAATLPANCAAGGATVRCTFSYNGTNGHDGSAQSFAVPDGITRVTIEAWGAQAGQTAEAMNGGHGGHARGTITVTPRETLSVRVGGQPAAGDGGFNGGGSGLLGGGGASDVRRGGDALGDRVVVAGGGGGAGFVHSFELSGGDGGGLVGGSNAIGGSTGGTQIAGGAGGGSGCLGFPTISAVDGGDGTAGTGGNGGSVRCGPFPVPPFELDSEGSGGGGGWFGGGGGGASTGCDGSCLTFVGPGGGGSGFVTASASDVVNEVSTHTGHGLVTISYLRTPPNKDACKNGGWREYVDDQGRPFASQGQCVTWTVHHH